MKIYLILLCLLGASTAGAQRLEEKSIAWQPGQEVRLDLKYAREIRINAWEQNELSVRASVSINDDTKNDAWSMTTEATADEIRVVSHIKPPGPERNTPVIVKGRFITWTRAATVA